MTKKNSKETVASEEEELEEEEFVVERIVQKRTRAGRTEYLLKWKGFAE
jgi:hypothetical protein